MRNQETFFLVKSLKEGDLKAFEKLYKLFYSKLYGFSKKFSSSTFQPDDFVQQTFLKVWENKEQIKEEILFDQQLFVICKHLILNDLQREKKVVSGQDYSITSHRAIDDEADDADECINQYSKKLRIGLEKMPKKRREIFLLHKRENLTYEEIAEYLCISKKTISNHIYLASNFLKEEFRKP